MEKVRPWCGQPSDRGRLKNRTEQNGATEPRTVVTVDVTGAQIPTFTQVDCNLALLQRRRLKCSAKYDSLLSCWHQRQNYMHSRFFPGR